MFSCTRALKDVKLLTHNSHNRPAWCHCTFENDLNTANGILFASAYNLSFYWRQRPVERCSAVRHHVKQQRLLFFSCCNIQYFVFLDIMKPSKNEKHSHNLPFRELKDRLMRKAHSYITSKSMKMVNNESCCHLIKLVKMLWISKSEWACQTHTYKTIKISKVCVYEEWLHVDSSGAGRPK